MILQATGLGLLLLTAAPRADVGDPMPEVKLEDFARTGASSYDDFVGRAVLIEFFAHW